MELKDVVLSVLTDIQNEEERLNAEAGIEKPRQEETPSSEPKQVEKRQAKAEPQPILKQAASQIKIKRPTRTDEEQFLRNLKERILVMFEGFNSPKNQNVEAKVDLTINFLEYLLSVTDERLESINASKK